MTARTPSEQSNEVARAGSRAKQEERYLARIRPPRRCGIPAGVATAAVALTGVLLLSRCAATELRGVLRPQLQDLEQVCF